MSIASCNLVKPLQKSPTAATWCMNTRQKWTAVVSRSGSLLLNDSAGPQNSKLNQLRVEVLFNPPYTPDLYCTICDSKLAYAEHVEISLQKFQESCDLFYIVKV